MSEPLLRKWGSEEALATLLAVPGLYFGRNGRNGGRNGGNGRNGRNGGIFGRNGASLRYIAI